MGDRDIQNALFQVITLKNNKCFHFLIAPIEKIKSLS